MPNKTTLSRTRASLTAGVGDTLIAAGVYDTLSGSGSNSLVAAANFGYLIAGSGANALVGAAQPTSKTAPAFFTTLQGNGQSTLAYNGSNNTIILNNSVTGGIALNGFTDYKTDSIIGHQQSSLARSSIIQTSLDKFDLSNTTNHGDGVANIRNLVYTGSASATLHGNNQNNSLLGGTGSNSLSSAGTTGKSTLIASRGQGSTLEGNGLSSFIGSTLGGDLYKISQSVSGGVMRSSDKIFENASGGNDTLQIATVQGGAAVFNLSNSVLNGKSVLNIENLIYDGKLAASLYGNTGNNLIRGGSGSNFLQGNGGRDTLDASSQTSSLVSTTLSTSRPRGSNTITINSIVGITVGQTITGTGFAPNTVVTAISGNNLTISAKTIASVSSGSQIQVGSTNILVGSSNAGSSLIGGKGTNFFYLNNSADNLLTQADSTNNITASSAIFSSPLTRLLSLDFSTLTGNQKFGTINYLGYNPVMLIGSSLGAGNGNGTVINASLSNRATLGDGGSTANDSIYGSTKYAGYYVVQDLAKVKTRLGINDSLNLVNAAGTTIVDADFLTTYEGFNSLLLSQGNNNVTAANNAQATGLRELQGGSGDDVFDASAYTVDITIDGGAGNNILLSGFFADSIVSSTGNDTIVAGAGNDTISGGGGADSILAGTGNNLIILNDKAALTTAVTLDAGSDSDTLSLGADTYSSVDFVKVNGIEAIQLTSSSRITLDIGTNSFNSFFGGVGNDTFTQNALSKGTYLDGGFGNDSFIIATQSQLTQTSEFIIGGNGGDTLTILGQVAGFNDSSFSRISGIEVLSLEGSANSVTFNLAARNSGLQTVYGGNQGDTFTQGAGFTTPLTLVGGDGSRPDRSNFVRGVEVHVFRHFAAKRAGGIKRGRIPIRVDNVSLVKKLAAITDAIRSIVELDEITSLDDERSFSRTGGNQASCDGD